MLKAVISHNEQATIVELPMDRLSLQYELSQIGIRRLAKDIPIMDEEDQPISVKLYSESDIGQNLAMLFRPSHSLEDANVCAHAVVHVRPEVQDEIEQSIVYGQYHSPQAVLADIKAMTTDLIAVTVNYYCPLQVRMTDEEYGDWYEVDNGYALDNTAGYPPSRKNSSIATKRRCVITRTASTGNPAGSWRAFTPIRVSPAPV